MIFFISLLKYLTLDRIKCVRRKREGEGEGEGEGERKEGRKKRKNYQGTQYVIQVGATYGSSYLIACP